MLAFIMLFFRLSLSGAILPLKLVQKSTFAMFFLFLLSSRFVWVRDRGRRASAFLDTPAKIWYTVSCRGRAFSPQTGGAGGAPPHHGPLALKGFDAQVKLKKDQKLLLAGLGLLAALLLAAAALYDLAIDRALYSPQNPFGIVLEAFCYWPLYLPFVLLGAVWTFLYRDNPSRHVLGEVLVIVVFYVLFTQSLPNLARRGLLPLSGTALTLAAVVLTFVASVAVISLASRWDRPSLARLDFLAKLGIALCVADNLVINLLKVLWTRMRFDDMAAAGDFSAFTPWYRWGAVAGNTSFPSGHTAAACGVLVLLALPALFDWWKGKELALTCGCYAYIALTALSRLIMGRHYLSDTVAAAVIMTLLYLALTHTRRCRRGLEQALALPPAPLAVDAPREGEAGGEDGAGGR